MFWALTLTPVALSNVLTAARSPFLAARCRSVSPWASCVLCGWIGACRSVLGEWWWGCTRRPAGADGGSHPHTHTHAHTYTHTHTDPRTPHTHIHRTHRKIDAARGGVVVRHARLQAADPTVHGSLVQQRPPMLVLTLTGAKLVVRLCNGGEVSSLSPSSSSWLLSYNRRPPYLGCFRHVHVPSCKR